ncbi:MAG TPA: hypothetical protein VEU75_00220, partial [Candidatus Acidoferrum sp.]|nr:hypothetical protein [Candidatus Acidoferrum sp.]
LLVTIPPLQMRNSAATQMNHVKRFNHLLKRRSVTAEFAKLRKDKALKRYVGRRTNDKSGGS